MTKARSPGGILEGTVTEIGITYLRLDTGDGVLFPPGSQVLAAGAGAARPKPGTGGDSASA